jgi:hypothetical protein
MRNRLALVASAMLIVGLLAGLTTSASSGAGDPGTTAPKKKKKKKCAAGTHKVVVKKHGKKKKKKCVPDAPPGPPAVLTISPASFTYADTQHGDQSAPKPFTVTNTGGSASGVPATSVTEVNNPIPGDPPGFAVSANSCTAAVAPGGTCTVTVVFQPTSNGNPQPYRAVLHVIATSGGDAQAALTGTGN